MNNFLVTNNGYGDGYGDGDGDGYGYGCGDGYGDGTGDGNGDGYGTGNGYNLIHSGGLDDIREFTTFQLLKPLIHRE